jgi:hypothetical protein
MSATMSRATLSDVLSDLVTASLVKMAGPAAGLSPVDAGNEDKGAGKGDDEPATSSDAWAVADMPRAYRKRLSPKSNSS